MYAVGRPLGGIGSYVLIFQLLYQLTESQLARVENARKDVRASTVSTQCFSFLAPDLPLLNTPGLTLEAQAD